MPNMLTIEHRQNRVLIARECLERRDETFLDSVVTGDETWGRVIVLPSQNKSSLVFRF